MKKKLMVWYQDHTSSGHNFGTALDKVIKFSGFSFLDGYFYQTKFQQNPWGSGREGWVISHGITPF